MTRRFCAFAAALITIVTSLVAFTWAQAPAGGFEQFWGARYTYPSSGVTATPSSGLTATTARRPNPPPDPGTSNAMHHWNHVAIDSAGLDHTPVAEGDPRIFGEQIGPGRSARAMAIVHIAIYDAVNAIARRYRSYTNIPDASPDASIAAAIGTGGPRHARGDVPLAEAALRRGARGRARQDPGRARQDRGHPRRPARRAGDPRARDQRRLAASRSRCWAPISSPAIGPESGARIQSVNCRSRSARIGAKSHPSSCGT